MHIYDNVSLEDYIEAFVLSRWCGFERESNKKFQKYLNIRNMCDRKGTSKFQHIPLNHILQIISKVVKKGLSDTDYSELILAYNNNPIDDPIIMNTSTFGINNMTYTVCIMKSMYGMVIFVRYYNHSLHKVYVARIVNTINPSINYFKQRDYLG